MGKDLQPAVIDLMSRHRREIRELLDRHDKELMRFINDNVEELRLAARGA